MKRLLLPGIVALTLFTTGCSEEFELAAPYKDVTLVYAMLDANLDTNYVRIQKAFMDPEKSAIDMAKVSDSNFYAVGLLDVQVKEMDGKTLKSTTPLTRVSMPKEEGDFSSSPNYAYRLIKDLNPVYTYRLVIRNIATGDVDSSETAIITNDTLTVNDFYIPALGSPNTTPGQPPFPPYELGFSRTTSNSFKYRLPVRVPPPAKVLQGIIRFYYWEVNNTTGSETPHSLDFPFASAVIENGSSADLEVHNSAFYDFFKENLSVVPANVKRYLHYCDIFVYAGSNDYYEYLKLTGGPINGLTSNEIKPIYSNIQGTDAIGLFTTRGVRIGRGVEIEPITFDSLALNPLTQPTGIQPERWYK